MKKIIVSLAIVLCISLFVFGEEGMWMLTQLKNLELEKKGFKVGVSDIYDPDKPCITDAIVLLGGGTSEFVSANGLLLTNHHVAYRAVQRASTKGTDFITKGFLAKTQAEEIEAPGYTAQILREMRDVTKEFKKFDKIKDLEKRQKAIDKKIREMTEKIEKGKPDVNAEIAVMYNGKQYILYVYKRFDDVRVVYVPPLAVGNYGGDIDNWMWPRHTGDFSFMRVYMAPDGTGRKYHKDNVPYKPKYWLKIAKDGLKPGDQTFVVGYPGSSRRYRTSNSVVENLSHNYPDQIKLFKDIIELLEGFFNDSQTAKAKLMGMHKGLNNVMKNFQGNVDGMNRMNFVQKKIDFENQLTAFLKKDKKLFGKYGDVLDKIKKLYTTLDENRQLEQALGMARFSGTIMGTAYGAYTVAREREKPENQKNPRFSEKNIKRRVQRLHYGYMSFYEPADKALMVYVLEKIAKLPEGQRLDGFDYIVKNKSKTIEQFVDEAFKNTKLKDVEYAKSLFKMNSKELEALNDPFINMAKVFYPYEQESRKRGEKFFASITELRKQYIDALYAWKGAKLYPDANGTIRFTFGTVEGYKPRDAVYYNPFTFIKGMLEKDTGKQPFDMPEGVKRLYAAKDFGRWTYPGIDDVPIAFTHKVDITGGNSGSPVLNAKGELVGVIFDGNYESMTGDWQYDPAIQRAISVDIRYVMWITEKLAGAQNILDEMGV
jgi:hypothetical protein